MQTNTNFEKSRHPARRCERCESRPAISGQYRCSVCEEELRAEAAFEQAAIHEALRRAEEEAFIRDEIYRDEIRAKYSN